MANLMKQFKSFYRTIKYATTKEKQLQKECLRELKNNKKFEKLFETKTRNSLSRTLGTGTTKHSAKSKLAKFI